MSINGINNTITGKDLRINDSNLKYNMNHYITRFSSPNMEMKLIFKIKF